jgi:hypothetical protein
MFYVSVLLLSYWHFYFNLQGDHKINIECAYFKLFISYSDKKSLDVIVLLSHYISTSSSWNEPFSSVLTEVRGMCYQPSCHKCCHFALTFKFVSAKILPQGWKQVFIARRWISLTQPQRGKNFTLESVRHVNLFLTESRTMYKCEASSEENQTLSSFKIRPE